jgi:elongation factor P hydroxylase
MVKKTELGEKRRREKKDIGYWYHTIEIHAKKV